MRTLRDILIDANAYLDLDASLPSSTELVTRANYANQAIWEAASFGQFSEFHRSYNLDPATLASISLPTDYHELMTAPRQLVGETYYEFPEIRPLERYNKSAGDKYCYVLGNPASGYTAVFNGLTANATLSFDYQRFPSGLLTLTDVCELPDPQYVVTKVAALVLESRNNDRFPIVKADANAKLANMLGREMKTPGGGSNTTTKIGASGYRIGT